MKFRELIKAYIESNKSESPLACPLCGEEMESTGVAWFCRGREEHLAWLENRLPDAYEYQKNGGVVFFVDLKTPPVYRYQNWDPSLQGVILAISPDGWLFSTVRGGSGVTNFRVTPPEGWGGKPPSHIDWVWAEWTYFGRVERTVGTTETHTPGESGVTRSSNQEATRFSGW